MKITLPWLMEHLESDRTAQEIIDGLTGLGLEVEGISDPAAELAAFSVAFVKSAVQHPNADRLRLCEVETRDGTKQIVCGAPNARTGLFGIYAPVGSTIPSNGMVLKKSEIRGVESQGMLCSARELGVGEDHDGIIELNSALEVGTAASDALGIEGPIIEIGLTPDRADCFGIHGIARDLAAAGYGTLRSRHAEPVPSSGAPGPAIKGEYPDGFEHACPVFVGRIIRGVRNGASPAWMQKRLLALGARPISALVDITNYSTFDMNRPLHVFDADKVKGNIALRLGRSGEKLRALDGKEYPLDESMNVIADDNGPISLGGIMGGEHTGCIPETTSVILEVAIFDPAMTAMTGRKLGIESDARTRFERGLDAGYLMEGVEYATRMIIDICGGEAGPLVTYGKVPEPKIEIDYDSGQLKRLAGIELAPDETETILTALGMKWQGGPANYKITPPGWRHDIYTQACIVEELARIHGFDKIPPVPVTRTEAIGHKVLTASQIRRDAMRRAAANIGLAEAVTWSFIDEKLAERFGARDPILLRNPIASELSVMRPSLLPNLLAAASRNAARKRLDGGLFELGARFTGSQPGEQVTTLAGLRYGHNQDRHWSAQRRAIDAFDAKADALAALEAANVPTGNIQVRAEAPDWYHPGRSGVLALGPNVLAHFGEVHPAIIADFDLPKSTCAFEIDLESLPKPRAKKGLARPPLEQWPYPAVERDFAFLIDENVSAAEMVRAVSSSEKKLIRSVQLFDIYQGDSLAKGKKSVALAVRFQAKDRTLTEKEIEPIAARIIASAEKSCGASLR